MKPVRPADVTVVLATALAQSKPFATQQGPATADEVAHRLSLFGFAPTANQTASYLSRIAKRDSPPIVVLRTHLPWNEYRVTSFGELWVRNTLGLRLEGKFPHPSEIEGER